jgi:hypothetical protein
MMHATYHHHVFPAKSEYYEHEKCKVGNNFRKSEKKLPTAVSFGDRFKGIGRKEMSSDNLDTEQAGSLSRRT